MTAQETIKMTIGSLVIENASLREQVESLAAKNEKLKEPDKNKKDKNKKGKKK